MCASDYERVKSRRFALGRVVATRGAIELLSISEISHLLDRHVCGNWGDLDSHDKRANEAALENGTRILSAYKTCRTDRSCAGKKVWIVTEGDRSATTVLLPREY